MKAMLNKKEEKINVIEQEERTEDNYDSQISNVALYTRK